MQLSLTLLGGYSLLRPDGERIILKTRKSWALIALLAQSRDGTCNREQLAGLIWPHSGEEQARASLRQELAVLRRVIDDADQSLFTAQKESIHLNRAALSIDTRYLEQAARSNDEEALRGVAELYQGDFLHGFSIRSVPFEDWLWLERQRLKELACSALEAVLLADLDRKETDKTLATAQAIIRIEPTHELAHRSIMSSLSTLGRRAEALAHYNKALEIMRRELDAEPSLETTNLFLQLRDQSEGGAYGQQVESADAAPSSKSEKRKLTFAAFGIRQSTQEQNAFDAEDLAALLGDIETICNEAASKYSGRCLGMLGDRCIMVFGYPIAHEHASQRAVLTAFEVTSKHLEVSGPGYLHISCGIATGDTLVTSDGTGMPSLSGFSGPGVTQAITLSFMADQAEILVPAELATTLEGSFRVQAQAPLAQGAVAYRVINQDAANSHFDTSEMTNTLTSLTGRDREIARLFALWDKPKRGKGNAVHIVGEAGIGKSRLVHSFLRHVHAEPSQIMLFQGSVHHEHSAFHPVVGQLRRLLKISTGARHDEIQASVRAHLTQDPLASEQIESDLAAIILEASLGSQASSNIVNPAKSVALYFRNLSKKKPIILVFEDFHWMDSSTRSFVGELHEALRDHPIYLILTSRHESSVSALSQPDAHRISLERLSPSQTKEMALYLCHEETSEERLDALVSRSDGIPLFLEELVKSSSSDQARSAHHSIPATIPSSLNESLMARIDRMGEEKEILYIAAVIGRSFTKNLLEQIVQRSSSELSSYLSALQDNGLVFRVGVEPFTSYEFKHALVQELTYNSILKEKRAEYHRAIATTVQSGYGHISSTEPEIVAWHLENCGEIEEAIGLLKLAGRRAVAISAHQEAAQHFRHALHLAHQHELPKEEIEQILLLLGPQLLAESGFASAEVKKVYGEAESISSNSDNKEQFSRVLWGLWSNYVVGADLDKASNIASEFLRNAIEFDSPQDIVAGHYMNGVSQYYYGQLGSARLSFNEAKAIYRTMPPDEMDIRYGFDFNIIASSYLLWINVLCGNYEQARSQCAALEREVDMLAHSGGSGFAQNFISCMYNFMGEFENAEHHARIASAVSEGMHLSQFGAQAQINLGRALDRLGNPQGAPLLRQGLKAYLDTGAKVAQPYALAWIAESHLDAGNVTRAEKAIAQGLDFSKQSGAVYFNAELHRLKAELAFRFSLETHDTISEMFAASLDSAEQTGTLALKFKSVASFSHFLKATGQIDAAQQLSRKEIDGQHLIGNAPLREAAYQVMANVLA